MRKTIRKGLLVACFAVLASGFLYENAGKAEAATEAVYEYNDEKKDANIYRGVVNTTGLNIRTGAGKENPQLQQGGTNVQLSKNDEVAILGQAVVGTQVWYQISFRRNGEVLIGFAHSDYINLTTDKLNPIATPTPTPTPSPTPTLTPTPTKAPTATAVPTATPAPEKKDEKGSIIAIVAVLFIGAGIVAALWYLRKKGDSESQKNQEDEEDQQRRTPVINAPLSADGTPIHVRRRRAEEELREKQQSSAQHNPQEEVSILADKERARILNEEMIKKTRTGENEEEDEQLREMVSTMKEKEILKDEIDKLRIGDMVYHEYFRKGIVRDNSDVKVIEISFGQDVRFLNKASCASKRLLRKL